MRSTYFFLYSLDLCLMIADRSFASGKVDLVLKKVNNRIEQEKKTSVSEKYFLKLFFGRTGDVR